MSEIHAKVTKIEGRKITMWTETDKEAHQLEKQFHTGSDDVSLVYEDNVSITPKQRRFIYALARDIFDSQKGGYDGYFKDGFLITEKAVLDHFKLEYEARFREEYSSSDATGKRAKANQLIEMLIDYTIEHDIALSNEPLQNLDSSEIGKFEYKCLIAKKCVICGKHPSDLHHMDTVGMGHNRNDINHLKKRAIQLCREHHQQIESTSIYEFMKKHHLRGIEIDEHIAKVHHLRTKGLKE